MVLRDFHLHLSDFSLVRVPKNSDLWMSCGFSLAFLNSILYCLESGCFASVELTNLDDSPVQYTDFREAVTTQKNLSNSTQDKKAIGE
ncbi:hypothetical protein ACE1B6_14960 [Aerosakkonemataceae cyanobacterium BLCC-F154]|uniref:Uncharacterized protein n=2 Tax=Floridanema TaxID=3396149 RepID=A0ABV4YDF7_9CYAN